jgi:lipopolysaccharide transport protein LptA
MVATNRNNPAHTASCIAAAAMLGALLLAGSAGAAEMPSIARSFAWSADVLNSDFRSDTLDLSGNVRVTQGPMSIEAGAARARDFRSDNSHWTFDQAVHIRTAEADLKASTASASFVKGQIAGARVEGSPAQFEQISGTLDRQVRGRAGVIEYDFGSGIVKLKDQVWFSNGKDEFRGDLVIYNVRDERVQINPGGQSSGGRVRGIIRPRERPSSSTTQEPASQAPPADGTQPRSPDESGA